MKFIIFKRVLHSVRCSSTCFNTNNIVIRKAENRKFLVSWRRKDNYIVHEVRQFETVDVLIYQLINRNYYSIFSGGFDKLIIVFI